MQDNSQNYGIRESTLLTFDLADGSYDGKYHPEDTSIVIRKHDNPNRALTVLIHNAPQDETDALPLGEYPHITVMDRKRKDDQILDIFEPIDRTVYAPLKDFLFENRRIPMRVRLVLALSLAAAFDELEHYTQQFEPASFSMDSIFVDLKNYTVRISAEEFYSPADDALDGHLAEMKLRGMLSPEYYEEGLPYHTAEGRRHILAVLIFRTLTAADPFDGETTLAQYPYLTENALRRIYGYEAAYVCDQAKQNPTNPYIGSNVQVVMRLICDSLTTLFYRAFVSALKDPASRPTAKEWVENQRKMIEWYSESQQGFCIPDIMTGSMCDKTIGYLRLGNGVILPMTNNHIILRYMLEKETSVMNEQYFAVLQVEQGKAAIKTMDASRGVIQLGSRGALSNGLEYEVCKEPWLFTPSDSEE